MFLCFPSFLRSGRPKDKVQEHHDEQTISAFLSALKGYEEKNIKQTPDPCLATHVAETVGMGQHKEKESAVTLYQDTNAAATRMAVGDEAEDDRYSIQVTSVDRACTPSELSSAFLSDGTLGMTSCPTATHVAGKHGSSAYSDKVIDCPPSELPVAFLPASTEGMTLCATATHVAGMHRLSLDINAMHDKMIDELGDDAIASISEHGCGSIQGHSTTETLPIWMSDTVQDTLMIRATQEEQLVYELDPTRCNNVGLTCEDTVCDKAVMLGLVGNVSQCITDNVILCNLSQDGASLEGPATRVARRAHTVQHGK